MKLKETFWDAPGGAAEIEVDYPDAPIKDFMDWMRKTSAWLENPELVHRRLRRLNGVLADWRNRPASISTVTAELGTMVKVEPVVVPPFYGIAIQEESLEEKAARLKAIRQANMAKARATAKANREARRAGTL